MEIFNSQTSAPALPLGGFLPNNDAVQILNIEGLGPVTAEISSAPFATGRGELHQGSSTGKRNIVLTLGLHPNWVDQTITSLRQVLYAYLLPEQWVKLRFFSDELPPVDITGIVESFDPAIFTQDPEIQVSIICPKPDFIEADTTLVTGTVDNGTTEVVIDYIGTVSTGFELRIIPSVARLSYVGDLTIVNESIVATQTFQAESVTIDTTMYFMLNTIRSARKVQNVFFDNSGAINILAKMVPSSVWPELNPGENVFSIAAAQSGQLWTLGYFNRFVGL